MDPSGKYFITYRISLSSLVKPMINFIVKVILQGRELLHTCIFRCPFFVTDVVTAYSTIPAGCL